MEHLAVIMDGNGRWAKRRGVPRYLGHAAGVNAVDRLIEYSLDIESLKFLSLFSFSSENFNRPIIEVTALKTLFIKSIKKYTNKLIKHNIKMVFIGDVSKFGENFLTTAVDIENATKDNTRLQLNIFLNYGGRWDIVQAAQQIKKNANIMPADINEALITKHLATGDIPDPDLLIRTGAEYRISNFMLWQLSYTELYFSDLHWPDFNKEEFLKAKNFFYSRNRRFGTITT